MRHTQTQVTQSHGSKAVQHETQHSTNTGHTQVDNHQRRSSPVFLGVQQSTQGYPVAPASLLDNPESLSSHATVVLPGAQYGDREQPELETV